MAFCSKCGADNNENAKFCVQCGNPLLFGAEPIRQSPKYPNAQQETIETQKSPVLAAILSFLIWGLGYWYMGIKKVGGLPWYSLLIAQFFFYYLFLTSSVWSILISVAFAFDVYQKAQKAVS